MSGRLNERCSKCGAETDRSGDLHCRKLFIDELTKLLTDGRFEDARTLYQSANFSEEWKQDFLKRKAHLLDEFIRKDAEVAKVKVLHREEMERIHAPYKGVVIPLVDRHRITHCYNCPRSNLNNKIDLECLACGWIICPSCGACGCGYEKPPKDEPFI